MFEDIAELLIKNVRFYLDQNWQSRGFGGSPTKRGSGPKRTQSSSLYNNITSEIEYDTEGFPISFNIFMEDYWVWVDEGRKPGANGAKGSTTLKNSIKNWILTKPVNWQPAANGKIPTLDQKTYLITRSIVTKGTEGTDFTTLATTKTLNEAIELFGDAYAEQIQEFLDQKLFVGKSQADLIL